MFSIFASEGEGGLTSGTGGDSSDVDGGVADGTTGVLSSGLSVVDGDAKAERRFDGNLSITNRLGLALLPRGPVLDDCDLVMVFVGDMVMMVVLVVRWNKCGQGGWRPYKAGWGWAFVQSEGVVGDEVGDGDDSISTKFAKW